jgi:hypothetical protein
MNASTTALTLLIVGIGGFAAYRITAHFKFQIGEYAWVEPLGVNGQIEDSRKSIFSNQYLIQGNWYNESQLDTPHA